MLLATLLIALLATGLALGFSARSRIRAEHEYLTAPPRPLRWARARSPLLPVQRWRGEWRGWL